MLIELPHLVGVLLAVLAAACFAAQFLSVRLGTVDGHVIDAVFISLLVNVAIVVPMVIAVYGVPAVTPQAIMWFALAGISGSLIARTLMFKSVQIIGASRTSPVISANVFVATILAVMLFDEVLTGMHLLGIVIIVFGVAVISWETAHDAEPDQSLRDLGISLLLPLFAAIFVGFEPILVTLGLGEGVGVLPGVAIKVTAAWIGFTVYIVAVERPGGRLLTRSWELWWYLVAGVTGTAGILAYFTALEAAPVVIVVPLIQTVPLMVVLLSWIFLPERLEHITWRLISAAIVVVIGAAIVGFQ